MRQLLAFILFLIVLFSCEKKIENSKPKIQNIQQTQKISKTTKNNSDFWKGEYHFLKHQIEMKEKLFLTSQ